MDNTGVREPRRHLACLALPAAPRALSHYESALRRDPDAHISADGGVQALSLIVRRLLAENSENLTGARSERDRLAAVLDQMTDGVLIADAPGEVRYFNPAAAKIFQISSPLGKTITEILRDHRLVGAWQRSRDSTAMQSETVELPTRRLFIQLVVVPDLHGGGSLLLAQDLTRMRRLETVRQDFVSNVSHELRTPLASLRALAETLLEGALRDPEAARRFLERMIAEVDALTQLSQELLDLASIQSGKAGLSLAPASPGSLLDAVAERMRVQVERAGLELRIEFPDPLPTVQVDAARLGQVLVNLVHNAIKFTAPGGRIVLTAIPAMDERNAGAGFVRFSVSDTGRGIPADELSRIFERFYRMDKARSTGGTGLGLSIARHIVEAHGGRIWAESVEGHGSSFHFTVPLAS